MESYASKLDSSPLSDVAKTNIMAWLTEPKYHKFRGEVEALIDNRDFKTLEDNFFQIVPFGTAGRRGTVGVGSAMINEVTIGEVAVSLGLYLKSKNPQKQLQLAIAHDPRNTSKSLTRECASLLANMGIKVFVFEDVRSTPQLSFTIRHLKLDGGLVVSASHNPWTDNGIKAYLEDGAQPVSPKDKELLAISAEVKTLDPGDYDQFLKEGMIEILTSKDDLDYTTTQLSHVYDISSKSAKIAYSNLHGAGITNTYSILKQAGFDINLLEEEADFDGNFTGIPGGFANPEVKDVFNNVVDYGRSIGADIAITNDPDADRIGAAVILDNDFVHISGNQFAALTASYYLQKLKKLGLINQKMYMARTMVTTPMLSKMAKEYDVKIVDDLLVGFKYIGDAIRRIVDEQGNQFIFGGEESFGVLVGSDSRDKDPTAAGVLFAEYASVLKDQGKTVLDAMEDLYNQYGYHYEYLYNFKFPGADGKSKMLKLMQDLRQNGLKVEGVEIVKTEDMLIREPGLPTENVLIFWLDNQGSNKCVLRPSGTEPKMKLYVLGSCENKPEDKKALISMFEKVVAELDNQIMHV